MLNALKGHLMDPALFKEFCDEFTRQMNRRRMEARASLDVARAEVKRIDRELERLVQHIAEGHGEGRAIGNRIAPLEGRQDELNRALAAASEPPPVLHPSMAVIYRKRVSGLYEALQQEGARAEAVDVIQSLVNEIILTPSPGELLVDLRGDLAGILAVASSDKQKPGFLSDAGPELLSQVMLVAGTRNPQNLTLCCPI